MMHANKRESTPARPGSSGSSNESFETARTTQSRRTTSESVRFKIPPSRPATPAMTSALPDRPGPWDTESWLFTYFQATGHDEPKMQHTYISKAGFLPQRAAPAPPRRYAQEISEGRTLQVWGVSFKWTEEQFRRIFEPFGTIQTCPMLIDTTSQFTFRWVIFPTKAQAQVAKAKVHEMKFQDGELLVMPALTPGRSIIVDWAFFEPCFGGYFLDEDETEGNGGDGNNDHSPPPAPPAASSGHGHPAPPAKDKGKEKAPAISPKIDNTKQAASGAQKATTSITDPAIITSALAANQKDSSAPSTPTASPSAASSSSSDTVTPRAAPTAAPGEFITQAATWANIANIASASNTDPNARVIDLQLTRRALGPRLKSVGRIPSVGSTLDHSEGQVEQQRCVFLTNLPVDITLQQVSDAIHEGPIHSISFGKINEETKTRGAGIVFHFAVDAERFVGILNQERAYNNPSRFGFIVDVRRSPFLEDDIIRQMNAPIWASRRLTLVKSQLFLAIKTEGLRELCYKEVGEVKVQLVHCYNGGNATVVFADVMSAIKMKDKLDKMCAGAGLPGGPAQVWAGLQTTFSKCPCATPLLLLTSLEKIEAAQAEMAKMVLSDHGEWVYLDEE